MLLRLKNAGLRSNNGPISYLCYLYQYNYLGPTPIRPNQLDPQSPSPTRFPSRSGSPIRSRPRPAAQALPAPDRHRHEKESDRQQSEYCFFHVRLTISFCRFIPPFFSADILRRVIPPRYSAIAFQGIPQFRSAVSHQVRIFLFRFDPHGHNVHIKSATGS